LKIKEDTEIAAKKRKNKRPAAFWEAKYRSFENKDMDWGGLYRDFSLHLQAAFDRPCVHDQEGDVVLYYSNSIKILPNLVLLQHKNEINIMKLKSVGRLETILGNYSRIQLLLQCQALNGCKMKAIYHAVNAVPCILHLHKWVMEKVMEMIYSKILNLHEDQTISGKNIM
jgi:hypothetical protein